MAIISITTSLKGFQAATRSVKRLSQTFRRLGQRVGQVGRSLSLRLTAPLLAMGAAVLKVADTWKKAFFSIEAATGATGKALIGLQNTLKKVAKSATINVGKIADILGTVNTILGLTGRSLEKFSRQIIDVSEILGEDAAQNARLFAKAMNQFKVPLENAEKVMGELFVITQKTDISFAELLNQVLRQGPAFKALGLSLTEVAEVMGRFNKAGLRARSFGPGLLSFFSKLGALSKKTGKSLKGAAAETSGLQGKFFSLVSSGKGTASVFREVSGAAFGMGKSFSVAKTGADKLRTAALSGGDAFKSLIASIKAAPTALEKLQIAIKAFGVDAGALLVAAVAAGIFENLGKVVGKTAEELRKMARDGLTLAKAFQQIQNKIGAVFSDLGGPLLEAFLALLPHIERMAEVARGLVAQFNALDPATKKIALAIGAIAIAAGPVLVVLGLFATAIAALLTPVGQFIVALTLAGAASVVWRDNFIAAFASVVETISGIGTAFVNLKVTIVAAMIEAVNAIRVGFVTGFNNVKNAVIGIAADIASGLQTFLGDKLRSLVNFVTRQINRIISAWRRAKRIITGGSIVPDLVGEIGKEFKKLDNSMVAVTARQTGQVISSFERMNTAIATAQARAIAAGASALNMGGTVTGTLRQGIAPRVVVRRRLAFQTGGSRVFTTPSLINVAEHGAERITAEPLGGGRRGGGRTLIQNFNGLVLLDEIGAQKLGREMARVIAREDRRTV